MTLTKYLLSSYVLNNNFLQSFMYGYVLPFTLFLLCPFCFFMFFLHPLIIFSSTFTVASKTWRFVSTNSFYLLVHNVKVRPHSYWYTLKYDICMFYEAYVYYYRNSLYIRKRKSYYFDVIVSENIMLCVCRIY